MKILCPTITQLIFIISFLKPCYTKSNAQKFIKTVHPEMVFFIKYEYWPNYLNELKNANIKNHFQPNCIKLFDKINLTDSELFIFGNQ